MELSRNDSKALKGIAIIGMMMLHFWAHPEWVNPDVWWSSLLNAEIYIKIGKFGNVCVSIFAFLTGYSFYINSDKWNNFKYRYKKLLFFLSTILDI